MSDRMVNAVPVRTPEGVNGILSVVCLLTLQYTYVLFALRNL